MRAIVCLQEVCKQIAEKIGLQEPHKAASFFALFESKNGATGARPAPSAPAQRPRAFTTRTQRLDDQWIAPWATTSPCSL